MLASKSCTTLLSPSPSLSITEPTSHCHSSANAFTSKGTDSSLVQHCKRSCVLKWNENAAVGGNLSKKLLREEKLLGKSCWDPWKCIGNLYLYLEINWKWTGEGKAAVQVKLWSLAPGAGFCFLSSLGTQCAILFVQLQCSSVVYATHWIPVRLSVWVFLTAWLL